MVLVHSSGAALRSPLRASSALEIPTRASRSERAPRRGVDASSLRLASDDGRRDELPFGAGD